MSLHSFKRRLRKRVGVQRRAPLDLPPGKRAGTLSTGGWVRLVVDLKGAENVATSGLRTPDLPASSEWL
jgi:hypothetical protein